MPSKLCSLSLSLSLFFFLSLSLSLSLYLSLSLSLSDWFYELRRHFITNVDLTLQRVLQSIVVEGTDLAQDVQDKGLVAKFIVGLDASGNHAVYNTSSTLAAGVDTTHIIVVGFSLISIKID
jgi:hypothetical protein